MQTTDSPIEPLRRLSQSQAAWLTNLSPRQLRDEPTCPRNEDNSYDAKAPLDWCVGKRIRAILKTAPLTAAELLT